MTMQPADAKTLHRAVQCEIRHVERLARVVGAADTAQPREFFQRDTDLGEEIFEIARKFRKQLGRKPVETGGYRRVGGKQVAGSRRPHSLPERQTRAPHRSPYPLENGEGSMSLVQMADLDLGGERLDRAPAAHPEHDFLQDPDLASGIIQLAGYAAVGGIVERDVGVEQIKPHPPNQRLPDAKRDRAARQVETDVQPASFGVARWLDR